MVKSELPIHELDKRHAGLPPGVAGSYEEAARVSLSENHEPPVEFAISHDAVEQVAAVHWQPPDDRCRRGWANRDDATRDGAYACAIAAIELVADLYAMRRAETLTGADYYVAPVSTDPDDLENCIRLEVSGTQRDEVEVHRRLRQKVEQVKHGRSNLPAIAAVVGFKSKSIRMRSVNDDMA